MRTAPRTRNHTTVSRNDARATFKVENGHAYLLDELGHGSILIRTFGRQLPRNESCRPLTLELGLFKLLEECTSRVRRHEVHAIVVQAYRLFAVGNTVDVPLLLLHSQLRSRTCVNTLQFATRDASRSPFVWRTQRRAQALHAPR